MDRSESIHFGKALQDPKHENHAETVREFISRVIECEGRVQRIADHYRVQEATIRRWLSFCPEAKQMQRARRFERSAPLTPSQAEQISDELRELRFEVQQQRTKIYYLEKAIRNAKND